MPLPYPTVKTLVQTSGGKLSGVALTRLDSESVRVFLAVAVKRSSRVVFLGLRDVVPKLAANERYKHSGGVLPHLPCSDRRRD